MKPVGKTGWAGVPMRQMGAVRLTDTDDIELEAALQQLLLDLGRDAVETDMALGSDGARGHGGHFGGRVGRSEVKDGAGNW